MALQDDIIAMLSQIGAAGDRATSREALGRKLYAEMGDRLSGDVLRAALRDVESARGPMGEMEDYSRVADILEKYMADAAAPVAVPDDMIVDDTRAAEQPIPTLKEFMGMAAQERSVPDDMIVDDTRAAEAMMEANRGATIRAQDDGLAGLLAGQEAPEAGMLIGDATTPIQTGGDRGEFAVTPRIPLKERLFAGQEADDGPMSAGEQLMFASSFIPAAMLPAAAAKIGMGAAQIARFLRAGKKGEDALRQVIRQRSGARMMRDPKTGRMLGSKDIGPFDPRVRLSGKPRVRVPAQTQAMNEGGNIRDKIMKTYGGM